MKYVISLGGSILVPDQIDLSYIRKFVRLILKQVARGQTFLIVTGGGETARQYIRAAQKLTKTVSNFDLDWMGISATKLNAQLLNVAFGKLARTGIINDPSEVRRDLKKVNIVSGWKPGWSTDYVAVRICQSYQIGTLLNLSNIDYVYDADPRYNKKAKKLWRLTWQEFRQQFGSKWYPGAHLPFDPKAAKLAEQLGVKTVILNGLRLRNLGRFFEGKKFAGTRIE